VTYLFLQQKLKCSLSECKIVLGNGIRTYNNLTMIPCENRKRM